MSRNPNELTIENSALVLIDYQPWVAFSVESVDRTVLINNVTGLALAAKTLAVPTVLRRSGHQGAFSRIRSSANCATSFLTSHRWIGRVPNAWSDSNLREAVSATGRKKLIMAGLWTEVCLAQTVLSAMKDGFDVYFVSDASGGVSKEAHEDAKARMIQAGARPISWIGVLSEWTPDYTSPERLALTDALLRHGGGVSLAAQYLFAQVAAGLVPMPAFVGRR